MKFKTTLILALILALGIAGVVMMQKKDARKEETKKSEGKIIAYSGEKIKELTIQPSGIHASRDSTEWNILEPIRTGGDKSALDAIASMFEWAKIERVVSSDPMEYPAFGLLPATMILVLKSDEKIDTLYVGEKSQVGSFVYARKAGSPDVFLTTTSLSSNIEKSLYDFRDKKVLAFERNEVNSVEISNDRGHFVINKNGNYWDLEQPISLRADATKISAILDRTSYQTAKSFVEENPKDLTKYGLQNPRIVFSLTLGAEKAKKTLFIGKLDNGQCYARDEAKTPVFTIDTAYVNLFKIGVAELRNKKLTDYNMSDVNRVEIKIADSTYICAKDTANEWSLISPVQRKAKSWKISSIISDISTLLAEAFADDAPKSLAPYGIDKPRVTVKLFQKEQLVCEILYGKEKDTKLVYCKTGNEKTVALIKKESFDKVNFKLNDISEVIAPSVSQVKKD